MLKKIRSSILTSYYQESLASRLDRVKRGIFIGLLGSTVYVVASSTVNLISFPTLHLSMDGINLLTDWLGIGLAISAAGFLAAWPTEEYMGIVGGGVLMTMLVLIANTIAFLAGGENTQSFAQVLITTLPLVVVGVLLAWGLRWSINRHIQISKEESQTARRKSFTKLFAILFFVGLIPGIFSRYDQSIADTLSVLNERLESTDLVSSSKVRFPESVSATIEKHYGTSFVLIPHSSNLSIGAMNITIRFADGYSLACLVPTDGGLFLTLPMCNEGRNLK
ncbi:MAG: hypothetical protein NTZ74_02095 [Chloroflexi bacterium]|nr:hypothetical protein [Chloroflexota bacterium]